MISVQNVLQSSGAFARCRPAVQVLRMASAVAVGLALLGVVQPQAQAQSCTSTYEPGSLQQRQRSGLWDGRIGPIRVVNNTENAIVVSLYHPNAPDRVFKYWYAEPGQRFLLSNDNYSSDWGIQIDEGPICYVGRVSSWDSRMFTTFPSRLFITDSPARSRLSAVKSQAVAVPLAIGSPRPETYEAIAAKQIKQGQQRNGLVSLLRAADLYRASGRTQDEQRVRDRIKHEIGG